MGLGSPAHLLTPSPLSPRLARFRLRLGPLFPLGVISGLLALVPFTTCLFKLTTGRPCPACGFTRASLRLARGDLRGSFLFHPMAIPAAVLLAFAVALAWWLPEEHPAWVRFTDATLKAAAAGFVAVWAARVLGWLPAV